jgi:hypothetical protein
MEMYDTISIRNSTYADLDEIEGALQLVQLKIDSWTLNQKRKGVYSQSLQRVSQINNDSFQRIHESPRNSFAENDKTTSQIFPFERKAFSDK